MSADKWAVEGGKKCYSKCSHIESAAKHQIVLTSDMWNVLQAMLIKFPKKEWQMMLCGTRTATGVRITDYYIPKQAVSAAYVENKDDITAEMIAQKCIVAGIHSHVDMAVTPSHTDINDSVMSLIDYHIIINNKHDTNGMRKTELPCGGLTIVSCDVLVEGQVDLEKMEIRGLENITDRVHVPLADRLFGHEQVRPVHYGSYNPVTMYNSYDDDEERTWGKHLMEGGV